MKSENMSFHEAIEAIRNAKVGEVDGEDIYRFICFYTKSVSNKERICELIKLDKKVKHPFHF